MDKDISRVKFYTGSTIKIYIYLSKYISFFPRSSLFRLQDQDENEIGTYSLMENSRRKNRYFITHSYVTNASETKVTPRRRDNQQ